MDIMEKRIELEKRGRQAQEVSSVQSSRHIEFKLSQQQPGPALSLIAKDCWPAKLYFF